MINFSCLPLVALHKARRQSSPRSPFGRGVPTYTRFHPFIERRHLHREMTMLSCKRGDVAAVAMTMTRRHISKEEKEVKPRIRDSGSKWMFLIRATEHLDASSQFAPHHSTPNSKNENRAPTCPSRQQRVGDRVKPGAWELYIYIYSINAIAIYACFKLFIIIIDANMLFIIYYILQIYC